MRIVGMALVAAAMAGCFLPAFDHCGYSPDNASWQDPRLWDALQAMHQAGSPLVERQAVEGGFQVDSPLMPPHATVEGVGRTHAGVTVAVDRNGVASARTWGWDNGSVAYAAQALAAGLVDLPAPQRDEWVHSFLASGQAVPHGRGHDPDGWDPDVLVLEEDRSIEYRLSLPHTPDVEGLWHRLEAADAVQLRPGGADAGPWRFDFTMPSITLREADWRVRVDAQGNAQSAGPWVGEEPEGVYLAALESRMAAHGLPGPVHAAVGGTVC